MNRREFIKALGAAIALGPYGAIGAQQVATHEQANEEFVLPKVRLIAIGAGSPKLINQHGGVSWPVDDLMYISHSGQIAPCQYDELSLFTQETSWQTCLSDLSYPRIIKSQLHVNQDKVERFIQGADWILIAVVLDNAMAMLACDEIAKISKQAGKLTVAFVGAPYAEGHPYVDDKSNEQLIKHSNDAVERMLTACHMVITNKGSWGSEWCSHGLGNACDSIALSSLSAGMIMPVTEIITNAGMSYYSFGSSSNVQEAIQEAIDPYMYGIYGGENKLVTSSGAVVKVIGNPNMIKSLKRDVEQALQQHTTILRGGYPFWRGNPTFVIETKSDPYFPLSREYYLEIISTGLMTV